MDITSLAPVVSLVLNCLLVIFVWKAFKFRYEKPRIEIRGISIDKSNKLINISAFISNPSAYRNLITKSKLRDFVFGTTIDKNDADVSLAEFERGHFWCALDYDKTKKCKSGLVILTVTDLKKRKSNKVFRLPKIRFAIQES